jgi:raffinose/stachyose/melibiose transport system permease protein
MNSLARLRWHHLLVFIVPAALMYGLFLIGPMFHSLGRSLFDDQGVFVGLQNYAHLFVGDGSERFYSALWHNTQFFIVHMVLQNGLGLALAAVLTSRRLRGVRFYRTAIFLPAVLSPVIVGFIWKLILNPIWEIGVTLLGPFGLEDLARTPLLNQTETALLTISLISVWQFTAIAMILFYAALLRVPEDLTEAATVDGANGWRIFWRVKFPLILPTVGVVGILTFLGNMNAFDLVFTIKGVSAGPNFSTDVLGTLFYRTSFGNFNFGDLAAGTAVGGATFWIIFAGALLYYFFWVNRVQHYDY